MIITSVAFAGALGAGTLGAVKYREEKRKKEFPWTVAAEKLAKKKRKKKKSVLFNAPVVRWPRLRERVSGSFVGELIAPYVSQTRHEQLTEITVVKEGPDSVLEVSEAEKEAKQTFLLASCGTLLTAGGSLFYAPLYVPGMLTMAYLFKDTFRDAYKALVEERRMGVDMIVAIELPGAILSGFMVMGTFGIWYSKLMRWLLTKTEDHSRKSLVNLFGQQPRFVWVLVDSAEMGEEVEIPFEDLKSGDLVVVTAGQTIPVDGTISRGMASIDQRMLTGEAQPAQKGVEESVFAGTLLLSGQIVVRASQCGEQTVVAQIGEILNHTADFDLSIRSRVETLQDQLVPALLALAGLSLPWVGLSSPRSSVGRL